MIKHRKKEFSQVKIEKIRGKKKRKNTTQASKNLDEDFILEEHEWGSFVEKECFAARVVEVHKKYAFLSREDIALQIDTKDVWLGTVARKFLQADRNERNFFAVGDRVLCRPGGEQITEVSEDIPSCVIEKRAPRASKLARLDPMFPKREHLLAVNMTRLAIVASYTHPKIKWGLLDRYLVLAEEQGLIANIILNKEDLLSELDKDFQDEVAEYIELYKSMGYTVLSVSADLLSKKDKNLTAIKKEKKQKDLAELFSLFANQISLLSGHSGVGKSSIVNLMQPQIVQDVEDEEILTKGRHTTSYTSLIRLGIGGFVIDSPGIRSFLIHERSAAQLTWAFRDMRPFMNQCKYRECSHIDEPECRIKQAVQDGELNRKRYQSYLGILTGATGREGRVRDPM